MTETVRLKSPIDGSIYAERPVVCRVHHSLEGSAAGCDAGRQPEAVDLTEIYVGELRMMGRMMIYADIREFFPGTTLD